MCPEAVGHLDLARHGSPCLWFTSLCQAKRIRDCKQPRRPSKRYSLSPVTEPLAVPGWPVRQAAAPDSPLSLGQIAILIPVWHPGGTLLELLSKLSVLGFGLLLVVDDGSPAASSEVFREVGELPRVEILRHARNRGKGRALKTGFAHLLRAHPQLLGVVTADADGQHTASDIERVARVLLQGGGRPVLGSRRFEGRVPRFSRIGNAFARKLFGWITGARLLDTQTGLRGLPISLLPALLEIRGERYEYETTMLAYLCRLGQGPVELPIETIYLEDNRASHFHPLWDSVRVYVALLRLAGPRVLRAPRGKSM